MQFEVKKTGQVIHMDHTDESDRLMDEFENENLHVRKVPEGEAIAVSDKPIKIKTEILELICFGYEDDEEKSQWLEAINKGGLVFIE
jgi:hypothetical protein